jgi:hypothetical protein
MILRRFTSAFEEKMVSLYNPSTLQMMFNTNAYGALLVFVGALMHGEISRSVVFFVKFPSTYVYCALVRVNDPRPRHWQQTHGLVWGDVSDGQADGSPAVCGDGCDGPNLHLQHHTRIWGVGVQYSHHHAQIPQRA